MRIAPWLGFAGLLLLGTGGAARAADTIQFGHVGAASPILWPLYIAIDEGFFGAQNLALDILFTRSSAAVAQQLTAGAIDMGDSGSVDPIRAVMHDAPVAIVCIEAGPAPFVLMAKPAIASIEELKGKTISVGEKTDLARTFLDWMLEANGMKDEDIDALPAQSSSVRFGALISGGADAAMISAPSNYRAATAGFRTLALASDYSKDFPFGTIMVNRPWAAAHPDEVKRFLAAYVGGVTWFYDAKNRAAAIALMVKVASADPDDVTKSYDFYQKIQFFKKDCVVTAKSIASIADVARMNGDIEGEVDPAKFVMPGITQYSP